MTQFIDSGSRTPDRYWRATFNEIFTIWKKNTERILKTHIIIIVDADTLFFWKFHYGTSTGRTAPQGVWYERTFTLKSDSFISYLRTSYGTSVVLQSIYAMAERSDRGDTVFEDTEAKSIRVHSRNHYPRESEGMFSPALVCLSVCVSDCDHDN